VGLDIIQQRQLFLPREMPQVDALAGVIKTRDVKGLARCLRANGELTLAVLDWTMRDAHELGDKPMLSWCLEQDRRLRRHEGGKQEFADAYAARLAWRRGVLRPVIGAGVSRPAGAPLWGELVVGCIDAAAGLTTDPQLHARLQATRERLRERHGRAVPSAVLVEATQEVEDAAGADFAGVVRRALSNMFHVPSGFRAPKSDLHCALAELAMVGAHGPGVVDIVTYNFDELLEIALIRHYGAAIAVASYAGRWKEGRLGVPATTPIRVWHAHGLVPQFRTQGLGQPDLVFSVKAYEQQYGNASSLASRIIDDSLHRRVCLFVGSSFEDDYQRAQLQRAHEARPGWYHYAIMKRPTITGRGKYLSRSEYDKISGDLLSLGVRPLWIDDHDVLPSAIRRLARGPIMTMETANHEFCSGPNEISQVATLYSQLDER
jgi:hypothetical protein